MYIEFIGDSCISFVFSNVIDRESSCSVLRIYGILKENIELKSLAVFDIVPTYRSLAFHFDPLQTDLFTIQDRLSVIINLLLEIENISIDKPDPIILPVIYDGADLGRISELHRLSRSEVIQLHKEPVYQVAMVGFRPHFPYLIGLHRKLITERLISPRLKVPAGSVAIGGAQTGIYPEESPGGWNLIGRTDPSYLLKIKPGDMIIFQESEVI
jgi:KipI family sensor histidine kinase inhibitor